MITDSDSEQLSSWKDKALFTPGPLTTSRMVKQAMLRDVGSRDTAFIQIIREIRSGLLRVASLSPDAYTAVLMQGSGTFGLESVVGSVIPPDGHLLVAVNGAYGRRLVRMAEILRIRVSTVERPEDEPIPPEVVEQALASNERITHVAIVHCETTSGVMNDVGAVGAVVRQLGRTFVVDAMSSFGAVPLDWAAAGVDFLISSSNKCIEGVPGFAFVLARKAALSAARGWARSLALDLVAQYEGLEGDGQFRFTPPTHALLAFHQALRELEQEGGPTARGARYERNRRIIAEGMRTMGFRSYLREEVQGPIISSFFYPDHPAFEFEQFYQALSRRGYLIYPGKVAQANCFRIGHIGRLEEADFRGLLLAIRDALNEMGVPVPLPSSQRAI
jgi:2-aminoethylphosphonate-pyruvate transaminase